MRRTLYIPKSRGVALIALFALGGFFLSSPAFSAEPKTARSLTYIDSFSPADLMGVDLPLNSSVLYPYGLAVKKDGTLIVACGSALFALDRRWQVVGRPGKKLSDEGNYTFAYNISLTPADTLYLRSADGSGLWSIPDGMDDYRRIRIEGQAGAAFGVMDDGSPFTADATGVRLFRGKAGRLLPLPPGSSVIAAGSGPEDTIWLSDLVSGSILVMSPEGAVLRTLKTDLPVGTMIMKLRVLRDGTFLAATNSDIRRFSAAGKTLWSWDGKAEGMSVMFSTFTDLALSPEGILYVNDFMGKRILRFAEATVALPSDLSAIAKAEGALRRDTGNPELILALADAYESMGAAEAARAVLARYTEDRPADAKAQDRKLRLETSLLKVKAKAGETDALALLERFGAETARDAYGRTMRTYESILALSGGDEEVRQAMNTLRGAFKAAEGGVAAGGPLPKVASLELGALFPALMKAYRTAPAGKVTIANTLGEAMRNVRAEFFIKKYMDFPSEGAEIARVAPGAELTLDLFALLNETVLEVQEDLPLQAQIRIHFTDSKGTRSLDVTRPLTLYRRTAISWDDTAKLAAFITPNEESISSLAFELLRGADSTVLLSPAFLRAQRICDALGAFPMAYVQDPLSPITAVLGAEGMVDTVRFPRTTLAYKGGDCDDTTALLSSLLEAAGIPTAIVTTPGHVFMAFDTGEAEGNAWLFNAQGYRTISRGGTLWIPLETTALGEGFPAVWKLASELVARHEGGKDFEFLPLRDIRAQYPPLPLPPSLAPLPRPDSGKWTTLSDRSVRLVKSTFYETTVRTLEAERARLAGKDWNRTTNRLAQLQVRYGAADKAASLLNQIIARDATYIPAYLNLAGLSLSAGKKDEALGILKRAASIQPGSSSLIAYSRAVGLAGELGMGINLAGNAADPNAQAAVPSAGRASAAGTAAGSGSPAWAEE